MGDTTCAFCNGHRWLVWTELAHGRPIPLVEPCKCNPEGIAEPPLKPKPTEKPEVPFCTCDDCETLKVPLEYNGNDWVCPECGARYDDHSEHPDRD